MDLQLKNELVLIYGLNKPLAALQPLIALVLLPPDPAERNFSGHSEGKMEVEG
jgi:hypothetical protein